GMALTAPYPLGVTNITWAATDTAGNQSTCTQTITVTNAAPTANAGPDQVLPHATAGVPTTVILDGAASSDPNPAQVLSFEWTQTGGPLVSLASANTATPSFVAPCPVSSVVLTFQLKVTDSCGVMSTDNVAVTVTNAAPTANAGPDQVLPHATAGVPTTVMLDGAASNDPEGQPLSFQWTQTAGTPVTLNRANTARPTFVAPCPVSSVVLTFQLKVTDSCGVM
ncbi:MAG: hypothetical protein RMM98_18275, partial [Acidobacteriota bacterium]|nr:hypothetical protein [Acidobacteriota bacterium]